MKQVFSLFLAFLFAVSAFFTSCADSTDSSSSSSAYSEFSSQKKAWFEPSDYTFKYSYSIGDSYVGAEFVTIVTDGSAICTPNFRYQQEIPYGDIEFNSITELYDYFDSVWKAEPAVSTSKKYIHYSTKFKKESGVTYPAELHQSIGVPNTVGYGGEGFSVDGISFENHKTFLQKKSAWKEPSDGYSFSYWIYYANGGTSAQSFNMTVAVDKDGNATVSLPQDALSQKGFEAFKRDYDDVELFGSGEHFGEFRSISEIFDLIEDFWKAEEAIASENSNYGIAPIFHAQSSYQNYQIPYEFECENFCKTTESAFSDSENAFSHKKCIISVRNFKK